MSTKTNKAQLFHLANFNLCFFLYNQLLRKNLVYQSFGTYGTGTSQAKKSNMRHTGRVQNKKTAINNNG
jgi:hypothetical protein